MKASFISIYHKFRTRWLILFILGSLIVPLGENSSAQDASTNDVYLPVFSNQSELNTDDEHDHDHTGIGHIPEHGRFTSNDGEEQSWPPQIKYIDEVVLDNRVSAAALELESHLNTASTIASQDNEIQEMLGERYTFISSHPVRKKGIDSILGYKVTFFSYSNNITIEAVVRDGDVTTIETFAASDLQPPLRQNEVDAAIEIAREYWRGRGNMRVDELEGFTIQTFRTTGTGGFYDTRMTYVSFHIDEVSAPELLTWVDLTTETIFRAAIDHGIENGGVQHVQ